jgi:hypothetical protein
VLVNEAQKVESTITNLAVSAAILTVLPIRGFQHSTLTSSYVGDFIQTKGYYYIRID